MMVLGIGPGGCGLASLAHLLASQKNSKVTKEISGDLVTWSGSLWLELASATLWQKELDRGASLAGDVAYYHLPYVWEICKHYDHARVVYLTREPEKMVDDLVQGAAGANPWLEQTGPWASRGRTFPSMALPDKREAAELYVEFYMSLAGRVAGHLPYKFKQFTTRYLDSEKGQREILDFCGVQDPVVFPAGVNVQRGKV